MKQFFLLLFLALISLDCLSQQSIAYKMAKYSYLTHPEKLFLCTDKDVYISGDTLWFNAWLLNATDLSHEELEEILYVDLVSSEGKVVEHQLFKLNKGTANGHIVIKEMYKSETLYIKAYTNFIKNHGPDFIFQKTINVYSPFHNAFESEKIDDQEIYLARDILKQDTLKEIISPLDIQFLPEGGNWVENVPCRMAFVVSAPNSYPKDFSGIITDQNDRTITHFSLQQNGRGTISLLPKPNTTYRAKIIDQNGYLAEYNLPLVDAEGYTIKIQEAHDNPDLINVYIKTNDRTLRDNLLTLSISQHYKVQKTLTLDPYNKENKISIPKILLKTGVAVFTLFDANQVPLCERLYWVNNKDYLNIKLKEVINQKDSNVYRIIVNDKSGQPVKGTFAYSFSGNASLTNNSLSGMVDYLYLKSELPGIKDECKYFFQADAQSKRITDLTMLTNGWRRFTWQEILADSVGKPVFPLERGFYISGTVLRTESFKPANNIEVTFVGLAKDTLLGITKTNDDGKFKFMLDHYTDTIDFTIQTKSRLNKRWDYLILLSTNLGDGRTDKVKASNRRLGLITSGNAKNLLFSKSKTRDENDSLLQRYQGAFNSSFVLSDTNHKFVDSINDQIKVLHKERMELVDQPPIIDSTDYQIEEVDVYANRIFSPIEELHQKYGNATRAFEKKQLFLIQERKPNIKGFHSIINHLIPEYRSLQSKARIYVFVDGELYYFTHRPAICNSENRIISPLIQWYRSILNGLVISDIKSIELIENPARSPIADAMALDGGLNCEKRSPEHIISIETVNGKQLTPIQEYIGIAETSLNGFTRVKEYYRPKYTKEESFSNKLSTYAWSPNTYSNKDGEILISLPKNLPINDYALQINGISQSGLPGYYFKSFSNDTVKANKNVKLSYNSKVKGVAKVFAKDKIDNDTTVNIKIFCDAKVKLENAVIGSQKSAFPIQTISDGSITISKKYLLMDDSLQISVPGWGHLTISQRDALNKQYKLRIPLGVFAQDAKFDAREYMEKVFETVVRNISLRKYGVKGVATQQFYKNDSLIQFSDFEVEQRQTGYPKLPREFKQFTGEIHRFKVADYNRRIPFNLKYENTTVIPPLNPMNIYLTFLTSFNDYKWEYIGQQYFNNRLSNIISFVDKQNSSRSHHSGIYIIDVQTNAIAHVQWDVSKNKKVFVVAGYYLAAMEEIGDFILLKDKRYATFRLVDNNWKLLGASQNINFMYDDQDYTIKNKMLINSWPIKTSKELQEQVCKEGLKCISTIKQAKYNPVAWRTTKVLNPDSDLVNKVNDLGVLEIFIPY